jgi:transcriptional regulator with XRE-family HTH domain
MHPILKIIGINVLYFRTRARVSQEKLAELAEMHRTYIGAIERGEQNVSAVNIAKIAQALNVQPYELLLDRPEYMGTGSQRLKPE